MPHVFGRDALADARWLAFLETPLLSHAQRSRFLMAGGTPDPRVGTPSKGADCIDADTDIGRLRVVLDKLLARPAVRELPWAHAEQPISLIHRGEPDYPPLLNVCADAPPALFFRGDLACLGRPAVAVVGSRHPSVAGARAARDLAAKLAGAGFAVISGLALGIDIQAHLGALDAGGPTVAVMATGIDRVYPRAHRAAAEEIAGNGLLVSEFGPGSDPQRWHFPRRNRTISGLSLATVVVEAGRPSGSLLTASAAADQGRQVFSYPWSVDHRGGAGCLYLLREGAAIACSAEDVMIGLATELRGFFELDAGPTGRSNAAGGVRPLATEQRPQGWGPGGSGDDSESALLAHLGDGEVSLPVLARASGLAPDTLRQTLSRMEIAGLVEATPLGFRAVCTPA